MIAQKLERMIMVTIMISLGFINIVSSQPTILEWICDPNIYVLVETTILCDYIMQANLDDVLNDTASNITLFAPNNQAFMDLSSEISAQLNDPSKLQDLLLYHAVSPEISVTIFEGNDTITMLNNGTVTTNLLGTPFIIIMDELGGRANIITEDRIASNGLVQFMDAVLLPNSFAPIITTSSALTTPMNTTTAPINTTSTPSPTDKDTSKEDKEKLILSILGPISIVLFGAALIGIAIYYDNKESNNDNNNDNDVQMTADNERTTLK